MEPFVDLESNVRGKMLFLTHNRLCQRCFVRILKDILETVFIQKETSCKISVSVL